MPLHALFLLIKRLKNIFIQSRCEVKRLKNIFIKIRCQVKLIRNLDSISLEKYISQID
jgi:hypothetical protein